MTVRIGYETHSWSEDNEAGRASGWWGGRLHPKGRVLAAELGGRYRADPPAVVFCSDLRRAAETAEIAFAGTGVPVLLDWRLRECDYGTRTGVPAVELGRDAHLDVPFPGGESWRQAVARCAEPLADIVRRYDGERVLVIGHVATRWALDVAADGVPLEELVAADFGWREGWQYVLDSGGSPEIGGVGA